MNFSRPKLNIKDTNICNLGSELEKKVKQAAANGEPAWDVAGRGPGVEVWRMEKFKVVPWPKTQYGQFYDGDSYIVLKTTEFEGNLEWDIYFWLGQYTTADEAGTAAYKTVELDDKLGGAAVQNRVVQGKESAEFLELWPGGQIKILSGGIESGFNHVEAGSASAGDKSPAALFWVAGPTMRTVRVTEVPCNASSLSEEDCFVLDDGEGEVYIYQGSSASPGERNKSSQYAQTICDQRHGGAHVTIVHSEDAPTAFWESLGGPSAVSALSTLVDAGGFSAPAPAIRSRGGIDFGGGAPMEGASSRSLGGGGADEGPLLIRVNHGADGRATGFEEVGSAAALKGAALNQSDVYLLLENQQASCWVGRDVDRAQKQLVMENAHTALIKYDNPHAAISCFRQGRESKRFKSLVLAA